MVLGAEYENWNLARSTFLTRYLGRRFFAGRTVLIVGAGHGEIGATLYDLGAAVTCSDGRPAHLDHIQREYPYLSTRCDDLDSATLALPSVHAVIHFGTLYHLRNAAKGIRDAAAAAPYVILESLVTDSPDPECCPREDESTWQDQSLYGIGCRPSWAFIEAQWRLLGLAFVRVEDPILNAGLRQYTWAPEAPAIPERRRMWIAWRPDMPCPFAGEG